MSGRSTALWATALLGAPIVCLILTALPGRSATGRAFAQVPGDVLLAASAAEIRAADDHAARMVRVGTETRECLACHEQKRLSGSAIRDWQQSAHAKFEVGCEKCHIPDPNAPKEVRETVSVCADKRVRRRVSPANCTACHPNQAAQFANSKHALAWVAMNAMPMTHKMPQEILARGCGACHNIGQDSGRCDSCHTRHMFSAAEARKPQACRTCHMGFDHPQWEMYSTSKHGSITEMDGQNWNWNEKLANWFADPYKADSKTPRAPSCAYCHMPHGDHTVRTAWGFLAIRLAEKDPEWQKYRNVIFQGLGVIDEKGEPTERFKVAVAGQVARGSAEEWDKQRERVQDQCVACHAPTFVKQNLEQADHIIKEADKLMAEAVQVVQELYRDGVLAEPTDRPPVPDLLQFYEVSNPIEQKLYVMFLEHRMRTFQGAFHMNPDYLHWYGWAEMRRDLEEIKSEAAELRRAHAGESRRPASRPVKEHSGAAVGGSSPR